MGLVTLAGTHIQYFSFFEEVQAIGGKFFGFIFNMSGGSLLITAISLAFIIIGVWLRMQMEIRRLAQ